VASRWEEFNGYAIAHGMTDLRRLDAAPFLDFAWYLLTRNGSPESVEKFKRQLWMPPKGVLPDARSPWSAENETKAFQAVKALTSGKAPTIALPQGSMRERAAAAKPS
jgi:hypothetical protein